MALARLARMAPTSHRKARSIARQLASQRTAFAITDDIAVKLNGSALNIVLPAGQVALSFFAAAVLCLKRFGAYKASATKLFLVQNPDFEAEYDQQ